ncbi:BBP7 family outer membrane beta-barrel protein [Aeoliella mucimassa]|uniref:BBP7 family outer membrane beta-barrel protein n=1 Tax=Aeoliella mucimassa TaxID=2527972 RepID=A0A518AIV9_9BACT|nr:BBP7 family outer membrane beta-barrel protein [Aeoliella mucimassa]QDU54604.1 hypothetical protein Pan181_07870 [Aeoliella mucimassa]
MTQAWIDARLRRSVQGVIALALLALTAGLAQAQDDVVFITDEEANAYVTDQYDTSYLDGSDYGPIRYDTGAYCTDIGCSDGIMPGQCGSAFSGTGRLWFMADYLSWQLSGTDLPPLVTASPDGTDPTLAGVLGEPTTSILAGNQEVSDGWRSGYRLQAGMWLNDCQTIAITGEFFDVGGDGYDFNQGPDSSLIIARPFYNTELDDNDAEFVSVPDELDGTISIHATDQFRGASLLLQNCLRQSCDPCGPQWNLDLVSGYRHYRYKSQLGIYEDLTVLPATSTPLVPGTTIQLRDQFYSDNEFHGGEIGLKGRMTRSCYWVEGTAAMAVGAHRRSVTIDGSTVSTVPSVGSSTAAGGLLTSSETNIGYYSDTKATVIPNFRLGLGCQLTKHLSGRLGYNVVVWNNVVMAADHLPANLEVDPRNLPPVQAGGGAAPAFPGLQDSTMVAHGLDVGLELSY